MMEWKRANPQRLSFQTHVKITYYLPETCLSFYFRQKEVRSVSFTEIENMTVKYNTS